MSNQPTPNDREWAFNVELQTLLKKYGILSMSAPWSVTVDGKTISGNADIKLTSDPNWQPPKADEPPKSAQADNPEVETPANGRKKEKI